ncbi:transposase [Imperialibacter roseus]|uniref:transposase n=1 Tax=Imperialibacter roseus TaxID=1324217 RepID=UPI00374EF3A4
MPFQLEHQTIGKKPLGRPPKQKRKLCFSAGERNPIEESRADFRFGQTKLAYGLNRVAAKLRTTSQTWIAMILFVTNLVKVARVTSYCQKLVQTFSALILLLHYHSKQKISRNYSFRLVTHT